jgi:uncharacterized protein with NAD-binding domain and iron-sulfur cluster
VTPADRQSVIILGAGPAGLTAAYHLARRGIRVSLLNQSPALGGHLRREGDPPLSVLGHHRATWSLLRSLGSTTGSPAFAEASLEFLLPDGRLARYPKAWFPTPLHQLFTIGRFAGLSWAQRWNLLSWLEQIWEGSLQLSPDLEHHAARNWLESLGHNQSVLQTIWNPLAHWLTGNDLRQLSAGSFVSALEPFFLRRATDSRICVPRQPWHTTFVQPITDALTKSGATLSSGTQAVQLRYEQDRVTGVRVQDGTVLRADWYVAALPPHQLTPLLPERWLTRYAYFQQISELSSLPCTVLQVRAPQTIAAPRLILLGKGPFPWIACKPSESARGLIAVMAVSHDQPILDPERQASGLLRSLSLLPPDGQLTGFRQEDAPHAVLSLQPGTKVRRPIQQSPIPNLLLAGSWTDTGWPANLESAIVSGERCADCIMGGRLP